MTYINFLLESIQKILLEHPYCHFTNYDTLYNILNNYDPSTRGKKVVYPTTTYSIHKSVFRPEIEKKVILLGILIQKQNFDSGSLLQINYTKKILRGSYLYQSTYSTDNKKQTIVYIEEIKNIEIKQKYEINIEAILYCCERATNFSMDTWLRLLNIFKRLGNTNTFKLIRIVPKNLRTEKNVDYNAETFIFDAIDIIIKNQNEPFVSTKNLLSLYKKILKIINKKEVSIKKLDRTKINTQNRSTTHTSLMHSGSGVRDSSSLNKAISEKYFLSDGSHGDNNYREAGRFISGPSYDNMQEDSAP